MIDSLIFKAIHAAYDAGLAILEVYSQDFEVEYKQDYSPLTMADKAAHKIITDRLTGSGIPVLSEEGAEISFSERKYWDQFWLVDPLDGTKEFVSRNGDFTVNIALIREQSPIAGVIYAPVPDEMYFAVPDHGAFRIKGEYLRNQAMETLESIIIESVRLPEKVSEKQFVVVASRSHLNAETQQYIDKIGKIAGGISFISRGSSLKFCAMAEGSANLYPRMGPTMEWDTAAGHAIAQISGCTVTNPSGDESLRYNKESLLNPWFVVKRN